MFIQENVIAEYSNGKVTLIRNKGHAEATRITLASDAILKLTEFLVTERYREFKQGSY